MCKRVIVLSLLVLSLVGCKVEHVSRITDSQIEGTMQTVQTTARITVMGCNDFQDRSKPSDSLIEADNLMKKLFSASEFQGCKNEGFDSIATYLVPMDVGTWPADEKWEPQNITIVKNQYDTVLFCIPKSIVEGVKRYEQQIMANDIDLTIDIRYVNDSNDKILLQTVASYVDDIPYVVQNISLSPKNNIHLVLSNVSSDQALREGLTRVFMKLKDIPGQK